MLDLSWLDPPLTEEQATQLFFLFLEDDTEDAPWMVMGDLQFWSASGLAHSLRTYAHEHELPWYVASMLPINFVRLKSGRRQTLAPDIFVAHVAEHPRNSYDVRVEGRFPEFVLEVISPSSVERDEQVKLEAYEYLGAKEYALFTPRVDEPSQLAGYRLNESGRFVPWQLDDRGRLWSSVLGLYLVVNGMLLQAQTPDGRILLTQEQAEEARRRAEADSEHARSELARETEARQRAEAEVERLRREIEQSRGGLQE